MWYGPFAQRDSLRFEGDEAIELSLQVDCDKYMIRLLLAHSVTSHNCVHHCNDLCRSACSKACPGIVNKKL